MIDTLRAHPQSGQQFLLLAHLYARTDTRSLSDLRWALIKGRQVCGSGYSSCSRRTQAVEAQGMHSCSAAEVPLCGVTLGATGVRTAASAPACQPRWPTIHGVYTPRRYTPAQVAIGVLCGASAVAGVAAAVHHPDVAEAISAPFEQAWDAGTQSVPAVHRHPRVVMAAASAVAAGCTYYYA
jgi:hypothetical protein